MNVREQNTRTNSSFLKPTDLDQEGQILTIKEVTNSTFKKEGEEDVTKLTLHFEEVDKKLTLNITNTTALTILFGTDDAPEWVGKSAPFYATEVEFDGRMVPTIKVKGVDLPTNTSNSAGYLRAADLPTEGQVLTVKGTSISTFQKDGIDVQKATLAFEETDKRFTLNITNETDLRILWGTAEIKDWVGKSAHFYPSTVEFEGEPVNTVKVKSFTKVSPYDLEEDGNKFTITGFAVIPLWNSFDKEYVMSRILYLEGGQYIKVNKDNLEGIISLTGSEESDDWKGKEITLKPDTTINKRTGEPIETIKVKYRVNRKAPTPKAEAKPEPKKRVAAAKSKPETDQDIPF